MAGNATDLDIRAVRMAQRNIHANEIENTSVVLDHTLSRFPNGHFNIIALNPPVEEGTETTFETPGSSMVTP